MNIEARLIWRDVRMTRTTWIEKLGREDGNVTVFSVFMILIILMLSGAAVDVMRYESIRVKLQHTMDRAVLAAADLDQEQDPNDVVVDYVTQIGAGDALTGVTVDTGLNYRTVTAEAQTTMDTLFMRLSGVPAMTAPAFSMAEERIAKVEISMVLDISGSMAWDAVASGNQAGQTKLEALQDAADIFIDTVIRPETQGLISLSLVPYSQQVNAGPDLFDEMNIDVEHDYSHCVEFSDAAYRNTEFDSSSYFDQTQHFEWNRSDDLRYTVCPRFTYERITPISQDAAALKAQIAALQPRAGTAIYLGMKWASALLDPTFRGVTSNLVAGGKVDPVFAGRPVDFTDDETLKTVILMTDGQNSSSMRIKNHHYNSSSEKQRWASNNLVRWVQNRGHSTNSYVDWHMNMNRGDNLLEDACDAAKDQGIIIWSIGFEVQDHGAEVMRRCASSDAHFFRVEGVEITEAFHAIARQINNLRLTQ